MNKEDSALLIKFRDDNASKFVNEIRIPIQEIGRTESFHKIVAMGRYRSRQYEIVITSLMDTVVVGMDEEIEVCE